MGEGEGEMKGAPIRFSLNELRTMTHEFSDENNLVKTQDFDLYRAAIAPQSEAAETQQVTIKLWNSSDKHSRFKEEMSIFDHPKLINCPYIAKVMGYCCEGEHVATVFKLHSVDTLQNFFGKDEFEWGDRLIAALGIVHIFRFIDVKRTSRSIRVTLPTYIVLNQENNPVLCDVRVLMDGAGLLDEVIEDSFVGTDPCVCGEEVNAGEMKPNGIFALGVLLMRLTSVKPKAYDLKDPKRKLPYPGVPSPSTLPNLICDPLESHYFYYACDYSSVCRLVRQCLEDDEKCPTVSEVVKTFKNLLFFSLPVRKSISKVVVGAQTMVYFTYSDLCELTNNFSDENLFAITQFGEAYRGRIQQGWKEMGDQDIIVKMWGQLKFGTFGRRSKVSYLEDNICRLRDEVFLLTQQWMLDNPNVVRLLGYCFEEKTVGAVYSVKPFYTLESLFDDEWLEWKDRIVVALDLARTIALLHGKEQHYVLSNLSGAHIMIDQDKKPILYDFSMLHGQVLSGQISAWNQRQIGSIDYTDSYLIQTVGSVVPQSDIFAFGVLLLSLICKRDMYLVVRCFLYKHVEEAFKSKSSVHESFSSHPFFNSDDEHKLFALAMDCLGVDYLLSRPTANEIVKQLESLSLFDDTDVKTEVGNATCAETERKPSLWKNLMLFKRMSITRDKQKKRKLLSCEEKKIMEGPRIFRPTIYEKTPEEVSHRIQLIDASLKSETEEIGRRLALKKRIVKDSQSKFVKQLVGV